MQTVSKIWMDGVLVDWDDAKIHVLTHTLHYGAGAFEGIRFYETADGPAVFRLPEHIDRLFYSAAAIDMKLPFTKEEIQNGILETIRVNAIRCGYIRPIAYYGYGKMGLNPEGAPVKVAIAVWPWGAYLGEGPVRVKVSKYIRLHPASSITDAKICGHYVNSILASLEVHKAGYGEALFLDFQGKVAEGPGENIFMVKDGVLYTPPLGNILAGITRSSVLEIARNENISYKERQLTVRELVKADELFFTGTAAEISAISAIDHHQIGNGEIGPMTKRLKAIFEDIAMGRNATFKEWLTVV